MMKIKRIRNYELGEFPFIEAPSRATEGSAGYDLRAATLTRCLMPGGRLLVPTGFAFEIPQGMVGTVRPRSGLAVKKGLHVMAGVIDSDYRGEVHVLLVNLGDKPIQINYGDRIAQLVVTIHYAGELVEVEELSDATRGVNGFGSTGER